MQNAKATAWGAGLMGMAGLAGALLGPSPLVLPLAPLVAIAYVPFMLVSAALGTPMGLGARVRGQGGVRRVVRSARGGRRQAVRRLASTKAQAVNGRGSLVGTASSRTSRHVEATKRRDEDPEWVQRVIPYGLMR